MLHIPHPLASSFTLDIVLEKLSRFKIRRYIQKVCCSFVIGKNKIKRKLPKCLSLGEEINCDMLIEHSFIKQ